MTHTGQNPTYKDLEQKIEDLERALAERKQAEEMLRKEKNCLKDQLLQSQKMEALGTLAGAIAHEFNNILGAIIGYTEMMVMFNAPMDSPIRSRLDGVLKGASRAVDLVQSILTYSRQMEQERKPVQVDNIVKEALQLLKVTLPGSVEIRHRINLTGCTILVDFTQIHNAIKHLCTHAAYAMRNKGGVLEVRLTAVNLDVQAAEQYLNLAPGSYVKLTVSNGDLGEGCNITERTFEPCLTQKENGENTELELAAAHGIVKSHQGAITIASDMGKNISFQVFLPIFQYETFAANTNESAQLFRGSERILLVDDEALLAMAGKEILEYLGYKVVAKTSSCEALEAFRAQPQWFDLVIIDLTLPNMTGIELARKLVRIRPDIAIILCTGFEVEISPNEALALGIREFIMKPAGPRKLAERVRKVLGDLQ